MSLTPSVPADIPAMGVLLRGDNLQVFRVDAVLVEAASLSHMVRMPALERDAIQEVVGTHLLHFVG